MSNQYARLLDARVLGTGQFCDRDKILDLGAYRVLVVDPRVLVTGTGNLLIETAAVMEEGAWRTIHTIALNAQASMVEIAVFLRFVRWRTETLTGSPMVIIDLVAKGG